MKVSRERIKKLTSADPVPARIPANRDEVKFRPEIGISQAPGKAPKRMDGGGNG